MPTPSVRRSRQGALPGAVDVVVVGGGAVGAAVAFQLADAGAGVLLAEAFTLPDGAEPTHFSAMAQRAAPPVPLAGHTFAPHHAIEALALRSSELYAALPARPGAGVGHKASTRASLHLLADDHLVAAYTRAVAEQATRGLDSTMIQAQDAAVLNPYVAAWQYAGAALIAPERWHAPGAAAADLLAAASHRGAVLREHCMVTGIERAGGSVTAVWTEHGKVRTGAVVLCAGADSGRLAASHVTAGLAAIPGAPPDRSAPRAAPPGPAPLETCLLYTS
ncbi:NAD(P)/FAD-dependent oxidoreductase, partial [Myceligenerans indicum]